MSSTRWRIARDSRRHLAAAKGSAADAFSKKAQKIIDSLQAELVDAFAQIDLHARPHQQKVLDRLALRRDEFDEHRHLVVAATGTGKTVMAALDYARLCEPGRRVRGSCSSRTASRSLNRHGSHSARRFKTPRSARSSLEADLRSATTATCSPWSRPCTTDSRSPGRRVRRHLHRRGPPRCGKDLDRRHSALPTHRARWPHRDPGTGRRHADHGLVRGHLYDGASPVGSHR